MPSDGESGAPPIILPFDLVDADRGAGAERHGLEEWLAIAAAALLHGLVILWLLIDWHIAIAPPEPEAVPVRLVFAPPEPAPPRMPAPKPVPRYRESGKDQQTTAPPAADAPGPDAMTPPVPLPPSPTVSPERAPSADTKAKPLKEALHTPPKKPAEIARAPHPETQRRVALEPAEREQSGDPYLNEMMALIERRRIYPKVVGQFGLPLEGVATYRLVIDRAGRVVTLTLASSAGAPALDKAGENMIRDAAPFPPVPADLPGSVIGINVTVPLFSGP